MTENTKSPSTSLATENQGMALYLQLSNIFRGRIESGEWKVGERIPTVEELYKSYSVSGMTIRQALGILEDEGLIERFRAKGTFVRLRPRRDVWCDVKTDMSGLLLARPGAKIEVLSDKIVDHLPASIEETTQEGIQYRHLQRLHSRDDTNFLLSDVYITLEVAQLIEDSDLKSKTAMRLLSDLPGVKIVDAKQVLTIERAVYDCAASLKIPLDSPVAKVVRTAFDDNGNILMIAIGNYRSDSVRIEMHLK